MTERGRRRQGERSRRGRGRWATKKDRDKGRRRVIKIERERLGEIDEFGVFWVYYYYFFNTWVKMSKLVQLW